VATFRRLTGLADGPAKQRIGKLLKTAGHDHAALMAKLLAAEIEQPDDAMAWITGALNAGTLTADDPWGVEAWAARHPDAEFDPIGTGTEEHPAPCRMINGRSIAMNAERLAHAAGLPPTWRGKWDALAGWLKDDLPITERALEAVRDKCRQAGAPIGSIAYFDHIVRNSSPRR
jgi:hypothetical protein